MSCASSTRPDDLTSNSKTIGSKPSQSFIQTLFKRFFPEESSAGSFTVPFPSLPESFHRLRPFFHYICAKLSISPKIIQLLKRVFIITLTLVGIRLRNSFTTWAFSTFGLFLSSVAQSVLKNVHQYSMTGHNNSSSLSSQQITPDHPRKESPIESSPVSGSSNPSKAEITGPSIQNNTNISAPLELPDPSVSNTTNSPPSDSDIQSPPVDQPSVVSTMAQIEANRVDVSEVYRIPSSSESLEAISALPSPSASLSEAQIPRSLPISNSSTSLHNLEAKDTSSSVNSSNDGVSDTAGVTTYLPSSGPGS